MLNTDQIGAMGFPIELNYRLRHVLPTSAGDSAQFRSRGALTGPALSPLEHDFHRLTSNRSFELAFTFYFAKIDCWVNGNI